VSSRLLPALTIAGALLLAGCQSPRPAEPAPPASAWPAFDYAATQQETGQPVYVLEPAASRLEVVVGREGPLARLGHDHVIAAAGLTGFLLLPPDPDSARGDLRFAVADMVVDGAEPRARHGLGPPPDEQAVTGTRDNLLTHVLDPARWPWVSVSMTNLDARGERASADLDIAIDGHHYTTRAEFTLRVVGDRAIAAGRVALRQTALGLQPFSALGGGLRVADTLEIDFHLVGRPTP